ANDPANDIHSTAAWRLVNAFRGVDAARQVFLDSEQQQRLINVSKGDFRNFVISCLLTGVRPPHEIAVVKVRDFYPQHRVLTVPDGKTGKREVFLTTEATKFLETLAAGRDPDDLLVSMDGKPWTGNRLRNPMQAARKKAKLPEGTSAYTMRHSHISSALLNGMNIKLLADNCGTSVAMIEKFYGKFLASSRRQMIEQHGPSLGLAKGNVVKLAKRR